jgi:hypothetical protein
MNSNTQAAQQALLDAVNTQLKNNNINLPPGAFNNLLAPIINNTAATTINKVVTDANSQVNNIPSSAIGPVNPVDIVGSNLNSRDISNLLTNSVVGGTVPQVSNNLVNSIGNTIRTALPPSAAALLNFNNLEASLSTGLSSTLNNIASTALNNFSSGLFPSTAKIPGVSDNFNNLITGFSSEESLEKTDEAFASTTSDKYLREATSFDVNNEDNKAKLITNTEGFIDPVAKYPSEEYEGRTETNKLATGDVAGTIVMEKNRDRMVGAKLPGGEAWDQPLSPYRAEYPYNKVTQTESGHVIEIDDTSGSERLHVWHRSGTFIEIDANGSVVKRTKGSSYEIIDKNGKIAITGNAEISVNGACNIFVGQDANIEVEGNTNITCHNDITAMAGGKMNLSAVEEVNITSGNVNIEAYYSGNVKTGVNLNLHSSEYTDIKSNTRINTYTVDNYIQSEKTIHLLSGDLITGDSGEIHFNSGLSQPNQELQQASPSNIGVMSGRKDVVVDPICDPNFLNIADNYAMKLCEPDESSQTYSDHKDTITKSGLSSLANFERAPRLVESTSVSGKTSISTGKTSLLSATALPENFYLSPNFNIEKLSTKATITKEEITPTTEYSFGTIVYNLHLLAINVLEPIYNSFPTCQVASGYRKRENCTPNSLHYTGQAIDIQFKGKCPDEVYYIAKIIADIVAYDTFILHYTSYSNTPWIHITLKSSGNRGQAMTFWNHQKYSNSIAYLLPL